MPALSDSVREKVKKVFDAQLGGPVQVVLFHAETATGQDEFTGVTRDVLTELGELSGGQISLQEIQVTDQPEKAKEFGIEQVPAMAFLDRDGRDQNLRFYGAPIGYEFMVLLEDLVDVSHQKSRLSDTAREQIQALDQPLVIQVFTTPT
jgi:alkyl hydroperoxide reductase subunit AhpF